MADLQSSEQRTTIRNVHLAHRDTALASKLWDVDCQDGRVLSIQSSGLEQISTSGEVINGEGGVLLPSSLKEALDVTGKAKKTFPERVDNLYARADRVIQESVEAGVTAMRAFVEVDTTVQFACLDVGLRLKKEWENGIQSVSRILGANERAAFAQERLFESADASNAGANYTLLQESLTRPGVSVVGSAPWVETSEAHALENISRIFALARKHNLHVDFHLDYNLDPALEPMIWRVADEMYSMGWTKANNASKVVTLGHATRLALLNKDELRRLRTYMQELPLHIVGLPPSDIYMMGRSSEGGGPSLGDRTLDAPRLWREHQIQVALDANNIENGFTPHGSLDPLSLISWTVGLYQAGREDDWRMLLASVTTAAKEAVGMAELEGDNIDGLVPRKGSKADFVILPQTARWQSAVLSPSYDRKVVFQGRLVAHRKAVRWIAKSKGL
ncbi:Metallo-dependent hydrolase [Coniophora puteana RWD-64-598 SS2]|uniref:Metallo-dependent hydrolase n=1 Tax=Coniophora puteana (strain RWD-64-598) TaxID=741705 RepID=A0A5M3MQA0_CONPW|nr:Metallo-dependent hydrolase [Coniophora puteana RWD-64-598 SS2]EIW81333.1 Metallo-dependent hydrolase [Coniophora puteana RWD-64-598 SS2]